MELTWIIIAAAILALAAALSASSPDTRRVLGAEPFRKPVRTARTVKVPGQPRRVEPRPAGPKGRRRPAHGTAEKVKELVKSGRKIEAIKLLHEQTGMGLQKAKELVDRLG